MNNDFADDTLKEAKTRIEYTDTDIYAEADDGRFQRISIKIDKSGNTYAKFLAEREHYDALISILTDDPDVRCCSSSDNPFGYSYNGRSFKISFMEFVDPWSYPYWEDMSFIILDFCKAGSSELDAYVYEAVRLNDIICDKIQPGLKGSFPITYEEVRKGLTKKIE